MLVALTGTPGTGKSSVAAVLEHRGHRVLRLDLFAEEHKLIAGFDEARGTREVDVDALDREVRATAADGFLVGHYAHLLSVDLAVVLRCHPRTLAARLGSRGWPERKVHENVEAEAIDTITQEAVALLSKVYEVDTTSATAEDSATAVLAILQGKTEGHEPGRVDWSDEVLSWY